MKYIVLVVVIYVLLLVGIYTRYFQKPENQLLTDEFSNEVSSELNQLKRLSVVGNNIVDTNGAIFQLRGVISNEFRFHNVYKNIDDLKKRILLFKQKGVNLVVLYIDRPVVASERLKQIVDLANWADQNGLYILLYPVVNKDNHIIDMGDAKTQNNFNFGPESENLGIFLNDLAAALKDNKNVLFATGAEPHNISVNKLVENQIKLINGIRSFSPNAIVVINGPSWGSSLEEYMTTPLPYSNILYDIHIYVGYDKTSIDYQRCRVPPQYIGRLPLFLGEFGGVYGRDFGAEGDLKCLNYFYKNIYDNKFGFAMYTVDSGSGLSLLDDNVQFTTKGKEFVEALENYY